MAQPDNTKANSLAHLHMRIARRVLSSLLESLVTRNNPRRTLDEYIEQNGNQILESEFGRLHRTTLFPRGNVVTMDMLPVYLIEFLIAQDTDVSREIKDCLHEVNQKRKELYAEIVNGIDDTFFTEHVEKVKQLFTALCQFMENDPLLVELQAETENIHQANVNHTDEVLDDFKHQQEQEKSHRKAMEMPIKDDCLRLHRMLERVVSIREADESGGDSSEHVVPPRPDDTYQHMQIPEAVIEIAVQNSDNTRNVQVARDIMNVINSGDKDIESAAGREMREKVRETVKNTFSYYGEYYARQGCIQIWVKPRTIKHLFELFEDCVSGKITRQLKPLEDLIRSIPNCENYRQNAVLYNDHYDSVMNDIAAQMCRIMKTRGLTLPNESTVTKVELSSNGTILVRVACPSINERDAYEKAITAGRFPLLFKTLEDIFRTTFETPDLVLNATVVDRTAADTADVTPLDTLDTVAAPVSLGLSTPSELSSERCVGRDLDTHSARPMLKLGQTIGVDLLMLRKI